MVKKKPAAKKSTVKKKVAKKAVKAAPAKVKKKAKTKPAIKPKAAKPMRPSSARAPLSVVPSPAVIEPPRAPVRRIMRDDRSIVVVADRVEPSQVVSLSMVLDSPAAAVSEVATPAVAKAPAEQRAEIVLPKLPPVAWGNLPATYPVQSRFYLSMAEKECRGAASWPFPFARFIASLPDQVCGRAMALLLMSLEHPAERIAEMLDEDQQVIEARLAQARADFLERCEALCPEMYRKMKTQIGGGGLSIENLVEKYLVSRVDRNFQLTVGAVVLQALRA